MPLFPGTAADGNGDGFVDTADYVLWRNASSRTANALVARESAQMPAAEVTSVDDTSAKVSILHQAPTETSEIPISGVGQTFPGVSTQRKWQYDRASGNLNLMDGAIADWPAALVSDPSSTVKSDFGLQQYPEFPHANDEERQLETLLDRLHSPCLAIKSLSLRHH
jgi:hypothetical protein